MKVHTIHIDEAHLLSADQSRNDIGTSALVTLFSTGGKRGIRLIYGTQLLTGTDSGIFGNMACRILTRLTNPKCLWLAQQSMRLSAAQTAKIAQLNKREVIVMYADHPTPFMVRVNEISFPPTPDEMDLEKNAQDFLAQVTWREESGPANAPADRDAVTGDVLRVFTRIAGKAESIEDRFRALRMDRGRECRARAVLEVKGWVIQEETTLANKMKIHKLSAKGIEKAKELHIRVREHKGGALHEYLLNHVEKKIGLLNTQFKFQRHSDIAREHGLQPDSVLLQPLGVRTIIEICCSNLDYEAKNLLKERAVEGVDMLIAVTPNRKTKEALQRSLEKCQPARHDRPQWAPLAILDAGTCLSREFDWVSVFERS